MIGDTLHLSEFDRQVLESLPDELRNKIYIPYSPDLFTRVYQYSILSESQRQRLYQYQAQYITTTVYAKLAGAADVAAPLTHLPLPPLSNRGGKSSTAEDGGNSALPSYEAKERLKIVASGNRGRPINVLIPKPDRSAKNSYAFVDWVNFTFNKFDVALDLPCGRPALTDDDYMVALSLVLSDIFGYGITSKRPSGLHFYSASYELGYHAWGTVCIGGQRESVLVAVTGQGLMSSKVGWEKRLYQFLRKYDSAKITRIDLASDNFDSPKTLDDYLEMYHAGLFSSRGRPPEVEQRGNWIRPNGKGRTLYVGSRLSGKLLRIYEKGLQLANGFHEKFPSWVRIELELKAIDRIIPYEALLNPGKYLAGAYPALNTVHVEQERIKTFKNQTVSAFEKAIETTRHQFGKYIFMAVEVLGADEAIKRFTKGKQELPRKINADTFENFDDSGYLHNNPAIVRTLEEMRI